MHASHEPSSAWVIRHAPLIRAGGRVLDLACGGGRNSRWLAAQGWQVTAVDRDAVALAGLGAWAGVQTLCADLESGPWPFEEASFDGIVVCRYLHRPLLPLLSAALAKDGVLIYETFMQGQERYGRPQNPDFLLRPNELFAVYSGPLIVTAFEQGLVETPKPVMIQRICAQRGGAGKLPP